MTSTAQRWVGLYLILLLTLAFIGVKSQGFYSLHDTKLSEKSDLNLLLSEKRAAALELTNPDEVRDWAFKNGMISHATATQTLTVAASPLPSLEIIEQGKVEVNTRWR